MTPLARYLDARVLAAVGMLAALLASDWLPSDAIAPILPRPAPAPAPHVFKVRLLCLKHSKEHMADGDADLAIHAAEKAAGAGLAIKNIGNHYVNRDGKCVLVPWREWLASEPLEKFHQFVSQQAGLNAEPGDTLIIFTVGHGFGSGDLAGLGQRADVLHAIASAAAEHGQRILWWQLSCHAETRLPPLTDLPAAQQALLTIYCSSNAQEESAAGVQGRLMEKVFTALAERSRQLDRNGDGMVTAQELYDFLHTAAPAREGLLHASTAAAMIF